MYDIKLNPLKCAFGISSSNFLGFMVTQRGIEANPIQLRAIIESQTPTSRKRVGKLTGRLVALGVDPTRSTGRRDSLLKWKENVKRKCGLIFEFWKIRPKGGTVLLWSRHLLLSLFLNGENQVRTKNPNDSSMEKKRSAKTKFLGPGIRLPIRKVLHMR